MVLAARETHSGPAPRDRADETRRPLPAACREGSIFMSIARPKIVPMTVLSDSLRSMLY